MSYTFPSSIWNLALSCSRNVIFPIKFPYTQNRKFHFLSSGGQQQVPLVPLPIMKERIAINIVGPLPCSQKGNQYILVICDYATRYPEAIPLRCRKCGRGVDHIRFKSWHPMRDTLRSGNQFYVPVAKGGLQTPTHPSHPNLPISSTDRRTHREIQQILNALLRRVIKKEEWDWDKLLPYVLFHTEKYHRHLPHLSYCRWEVREPLDVLKKNRKQTRGVMRVLCHICCQSERRWRWWLLL